MPAISVLLCVHNPDREQLEQAVDSMIAQTFTDWEMILYDDGSDARSEEMIRSLADRERRIFYVRGAVHHSLAYGLNVGIGLAGGEYIARMDADDISFPERLEKEWEFLERHPEYDFVGCNLELMDESGRRWGCRRYPERPEKEDFLEYSPYPHPAMMFRKKTLTECGAYGEGKKPCRGEDYELFIRLHAAGKRGVNLQETLFSYRESWEGYRRRLFRFQVQEVGIRIRGFRMLGIPCGKNLKYIIKPIIVWAIPNRLLLFLKRRRTEAQVRRWET